MKIKWNSEQIPKMNVKNNKDVTFLTYPAYEEMNWLVHGFSTRFGGVSRGIYSSMNLSFTRGDEESCVKENYRRISDAMGFDMNSIVTSVYCNPLIIIETALMNILPYSRKGIMKYEDKMEQ